jgi:hypothetical protein
MDQGRVGELYALIASNEVQINVRAGLLFLSLQIPWVNNDWTSPSWSIGWLLPRKVRHFVNGQVPILRVTTVGLFFLNQLVLKEPKIYTRSKARSMPFVAWMRAMSG